VRKLQLEKVGSGLEDLVRQYNEAVGARDWERARELDRIKRKFQFEKVGAEIEKLEREYNEAVGAGDARRARELDRIKSNLDKELQRLGRT
jgi:DNA anti-recombination protein RmuC